MTEQERFGPPPVEPLSDVAWARVERGLWARMDGVTLVDREVPARSWRWLWIATPIVGAAAALAIVIGTRGDTPPPIVSQLGEPSRVVSGAAPSSISFGDAHIELDAKSAVAMRRDGRKPVALLENGAAWFTVTPRHEKEAFVVLAGDTIVRVVGTRFRVARAEERVSVEVEHGMVDVQFRGTLLQVGAQQAWSTDHPREVTSIHRDPVSVKADVTASMPDVTTDDTTLDNRRKPPRATTKTTTTKATTAVKPDKPAIAAGSNDAKAEPVVVDAERAKFERLTALEAKDPKAALAGYLELSQRSGRWAEVALFAAGRLAADRKDPRARTMLEIYLRRFPGGANVDDARQLLSRLNGD